MLHFDVRVKSSKMKKSMNSESFAVAAGRKTDSHSIQFSTTLRLVMSLRILWQIWFS